MTSAHEAWTNAVESIQQKNDGMDLWLGQVNCVGLTDGRLLLEVPNRFTRDWISERYLSSILSRMKDVVDDDVEVEFKYEPTPAAQGRPSPAPPRAVVARPPAPSPKTAINPRFTFEAFVEGPSNQLAHSACRAIATRAARSVSPVFVCGPSGLGKTHLLTAIHHALGGEGQAGPVVYTSAEAFMNDFVESLSAGRMQEFRERYRRGCGVLLVDDIQLIASREKTQEEFFHVFNELYNTGRPIVITSDRPPREIGKIEERLRSRFEWGLIADIRPPELETRMAIARKKAEQMGLRVPEEVIGFVAESASGSVREIEGVLIRLDVQSSLTGRPINVEMAREIIGLMGAVPDRKVNAEEVIRQVAACYGVKVSDIKGSRRHRSVARPRQVAMYICRSSLSLSFPEIGERFGGRDHSTVMNAVKKISGLLPGDADLRSSIDSLTRKLGC